ncbi:hypothetical protein [Gallibacterium anatis]|uniref:Uncharacterized protein n=1 Tax=Gallibacterium anatis TaxID=750 RepID=A0A1A7P936_9PAST|nr:hypothetical protein [Gallibacterium anatis]OBW98568.1 hypothetical protein QV03_05915 [Gallibacterium anatis]
MDSQMIDKLSSWVQKKPLILIRFDEAFSRQFYELRNGLVQTTLTKPHSVFEFFKLPTLCLIEMQHEERAACYLGLVSNKSTISSFESRITIKSLTEISINKLSELREMLSDITMKRWFDKKQPENKDISISLLSKKLSKNIIEVLAENEKNRSALEKMYALSPGLRQLSNQHWAQKESIAMAMSVFGINLTESAESVILKKGKDTGLSQINSEIHLYEDNVIHFDGNHFLNFKKIEETLTGKAIFKKNDEELTIYTANKLPLERAMGVDLIYVNQTQENIVMVQHKMLEQAGEDWIYRKDGQLDKEINRMKLPLSVVSSDRFRLNANPYFLKFVKRKTHSEKKVTAFIIALEHFKQFILSPKSKGKNGGIRISYKALDGSYLREKEFLGLIRSGYIGTYVNQFQALQVIIDEIAKGNKAAVIAWEDKIQEMNDENN